ncbi:aspartate aminotransferase family protein [uncultured Thermanaerothrix sp.]|uniref:aspartate aminotransferase family protein n=1 Tax=uncultured Thermanaerothrix sp. TaxID=1195149 RepID=UPI0026117D9A|nr:aspartate aminotransferase family protein [uncultured Thermanaerothrix sp.]
MNTLTMMDSVQTVEARHTSGLYNKQPITLVRGEGAWLWDEQGRNYIDCTSGQGVANLGHGRIEIARAIAEQAQRLITCPETFFNDQRAALMEELTALTPGLERVFFCNSGTEAVEAAIKFSRYSTGRKQVVATMRGFHGRTMGALSATWNKKYREPFEPLVPGFVHVPYNNLEAMQAAISEDTAAVILEIVQGEGGVYPAHPDYLRGVQALCRERGALLIIDEVQTGFGRTGRMFAYQHYALQPDLLCVAKSLAGGLPMGAVLMGERVRALSPGLHGSTFGGNPLACAAARATLRILQREDLPAQAARKGAYFMERLRQIRSPLIREVRGLGLMVGVELKQKVAPYLSLMQERGVLALSAGLNVIRFLPPLVIREAQLDRVVETLEEVLALEAVGVEEPDKDGR